MLMVKSELSGEDAACTICQGIELSSGRIGAIADIDLFAAFTVDMEEAAAVINKETGGNLRARGDLWEVSKRRETRFDNTVAKTTEDGKVGVDLISQRLAAGLDIWTGEAIEEDEGDEE